jgi:hypothetical protein
MPPVGFEPAISVLKRAKAVRALDCSATAIGTQNKRTQTSMPPVRFEPTISVLERAKTVNALDLAATVIGSFKLYATKKT